MYCMQVLIIPPVNHSDFDIVITDGTNSVQGATVTIGTNATTTDSNGKVHYEDISDGSTSVTVTKTGFQDKTTTITVGSASSFTIALTPVGTLTVTVTDSEDTPSAIEGATVVIGETTKTTDANGKAEFPNLTYEDKSATISATGYTTKSETLAFRSNHKSFTVALVEAEQGDG